MAEKKFKYIPFMAARGVARYPKLSEPDTKGEYADGKYKTEFVFEDASEEEAFQEQIKQVAKDQFGAKANKAHMPWKEGKDGETIFVFKSPKKKPLLQDAKNKPLKAGTIVRGGSIIRLAGVIAPWEKGAKCGVSLWPDAARILKLSEGGFAGFGAPEDGFDADDHDPQSFGDEPEEGGDAGSEGDADDALKL